MKQIKSPYGDKFTQIVEAPDDIPTEKLMLQLVDTVVAWGCRVTIINNDTQQVVAQWIPAEHKVINADYLQLSDPSLLWLKVRKKPVVVHALQIETTFETTTLEGKLKGKAGDYVIIGVNGERYPIDKEIFEKTYDILSEETAIDHFVKTTSSNPPTEEDIIEKLNKEVSPSFRDAVKTAMSQPPIKIERGDSLGLKGSKK